MMKTLLFFLILLISCGPGLSSYSEESLKIDVSKLSSACDCNNALIILMKEQINILEDIINHKLSKEDSAYIDKEYIKRHEKGLEILKHCNPIYQKEGGLGKCDNLREGELLDKKLNELRSKAGM